MYGSSLPLKNVQGCCFRVALHPYVDRASQGSTSFHFQVLHRNELAFFTCQLGPVAFLVWPPSCSWVDTVGSTQEAPDRLAEGPDPPAVAPGGTQHFRKVL